jgi:hypothetical protein
VESGRRAENSGRKLSVEKSVVKSDVPDLGVPLNMAVRYGDLLFVSGIPPFRESFASQLRTARESGNPLPRFPAMPFEEQATVTPPSSIGCTGATSVRNRRCRHERGYKPVACRWTAGSRSRRLDTYPSIPRTRNRAWNCVRPAAPVRCFRIEVCWS